MATIEAVLRSALKFDRNFTKFHGNVGPTISLPNLKEFKV